MNNLNWGTPSRRVCWLVVPTTVDHQIPDDHTIEYVLSHPYDMGRPPQPFLWTIDREEAAQKSKELYARKSDHQIHTIWRDPEGRRVKKLDAIRKASGVELFGSDQT